MNLPRKWNVLDLHSDKKYYYGVDFATDKWHYSLYVTDFSNVWICDVDDQKLHFKALQNGIELDSIGSVYQTLLSSFQNNFNDSTTKIDIDELKIDKGVPLELKLNMVKIFTNAELNWNFDFVILPDSSAITILRNLIFHMSTVIFSLNEYKDDLVRLIEHKDSAIRFLGESIEGMNGGHLISRWAPQNSANSRVLRSFGKSRFDELWKKKRMPQIEDQYIWDVLKSNSSNSTWEYSTTFQDQPSTGPTKDDDRKPIADSFEEVPVGGDIDDDFENPMDEDDDHERGMDSLSIDEEGAQRAKKTTSQKRNSDTETGSETDVSSSPEASAPLPPKTSTSPTHSPTDTKSTASPASTSPEKPNAPASAPASETQTREPSATSSTNTPSPSKPKRHFGAINRKRKISHSGFSPIKAPKQFQSKD